MKRGRISRVIQLMTVLQTHQRCASNELAAILGTSSRTLFRDLRCLREAGVSYRFDTKQQGYTVERGVFLPPPALTKEEAFGLLLLVYKARNQLNLPFRDAALKAGLKVEAGLKPEVRRYCNRALQAISLKGGPQTVAEGLDKLFAKIRHAVVEKHTLNVRYFEPTEQTEVKIEFQPRHLLYARHGWHMLGSSPTTPHIRTIELSRIRDVLVLNRKFVAEAGFDIGEYLGRAWSLSPEGRLYTVKLRFSREVAHDVTDVQWHHTQAVSFEDDGSAIVEFRIDGLNEITWWILSYGDHVEVLTPRVLRRRIAEIADGMARCHQAAALPAKSATRT